MFPFPTAAEWSMPVSMTKKQPDLSTPEVQTSTDKLFAVVKTVLTSRYHNLRPVTQPSFSWVMAMPFVWLYTRTS